MFWYYLITNLLYSLCVFILKTLIFFFLYEATLCYDDREKQKNDY